jgi:diguanylate cyclase (GGDEF)-like protein/PAS domain S-box-containing protein
MDLVTDKHEKRPHEANKRTQLKYAMRTIDNNPDGVFWSDINGNIVYVNQAACEKLGYSQDEFMEIGITGIDSTISAKDFGESSELVQAVRSGKTLRIQTKHSHRDGHAIPVEITMGTLDIGKNSFGFSIVRDISAHLEGQNKLKKAYSELEEKNAELNKLNKKLATREAQLEHLAYHDTLTGLPNRSLLMRNLPVLTSSIQANSKVAMLFIDIDNFKYINDSFGHCKGDDVLKEVCRRIQTLLKDSNQFYRIGGDEFIVLLLDNRSFDQIESFAESVMKCLSYPYQIETFEMQLRCSIGIAVFPDHTTSYDELLRYSDAAMYKAKENGKNRYCIFHNKMKFTNRQ